MNIFYTLSYRNYFSSNNRFKFFASHKLFERVKPAQNVADTSSQSSMLQEAPVAPIVVNSLHNSNTQFEDRTLHPNDVIIDSLMYECSDVGCLKSFWNYDPCEIRQHYILLRSIFLKKFDHSDAHQSPSFIIIPPLNDFQTWIDPIPSGKRVDGDKLTFPASFILRFSLQTMTTGSRWLL